jgi:hypothetical protein
VCCLTEYHPFPHTVAAYSPPALGSVSNSDSTSFCPSDQVFDSYIPPSTGDSSTSYPPHQVFDFFVPSLTADSPTSYPPNSPFEPSAQLVGKTEPISPTAEFSTGGTPVMEFNTASEISDIMGDAMLPVLNFNSCEIVMENDLDLKPG